MKQWWGSIIYINCMGSNSCLVLLKGAVLKFYFGSYGHCKNLSNSSIPKDFRD